MADLATMTPAKLKAAQEKSAEAMSKACKDCIDAGYGNLRFSEMRAMEDKPESVAAFLAANDRERTFQEECDRRIKYHGSLKRI